MVQHVNGTLYTNERIFSSVIWVVPAFLIIGGYNTISSWKQNRTINVKRKITKIFIPYIVCTCIYTIWENHFLDIEVIWQKVLHFNAAGPLYFVAVYIQLVVISPFLIGCICWSEERNKIARHMLILFLILGMSYLCTHYTNILGIALGGGNLFSGFWPIFWYGGMVLYIRKRNPEIRWKTVVSSILLIGCLLWEYFFVFRDFNNIFRSKFGNMYHMSAYMTWWNALEAFLIVLFFKEIVEIFEMKENKIAMQCLKPICCVGKKSLCIFMYHILFRDIYFTYFSYGSIWERRAMCFGFMIGWSILLDFFLRRLGKNVREVYDKIKM